MPSPYDIQDTFKREYMCITTVGITPNGNSSDELLQVPETVSPDACWGEFVNQTGEHNVVYLGNDTACIMNLPTDLRISMLQRMIDLFTENPINCHVQFAYDDTATNVLAFILVIILFISMFCLILTILVYAIKGDLLSIPGLNLTCLCLSHFVHYLTGVINLFNIPHYKVSQAVCTLFGFTRNFTILATFFWLNVMAFDIWRTIVSMEVNTSSIGSKKLFKWKRFLKYSLYAWGVALFIAVWAVIFDNIDSIPENWRPSYRRPYLEDPDLRCAMSGNNLGSLLLFNTLPRIMVLLANCIFFFLTARTIHKANNQAATMRTNKSTRNTFRLYIKLFVVMGLAWSLNIIDYIIHSYYGIDWVWSGPRWLTMTSDYITALIGVAIYVTFGLVPTISLARQKCSFFTKLPRRLTSTKVSSLKTNVESVKIRIDSTTSDDKITSTSL